MKTIPLSGEKGIGKTAIVDDEDYEKICKIKWFDVQGYARSRDGISMHRLIMSPPSNMEIDHKNHNRLASYKFECVRNGIKYSKYGFKTIKEAVEYRDKFFAERGEVV